MVPQVGCSGREREGFRRPRNLEKLLIRVYICDNIMARSWCGAATEQAELRALIDIPSAVGGRWQSRAICEHKRVRSWRKSLPVPPKKEPPSFISFRQISDFKALALICLHLACRRIWIGGPGQRLNSRTILTTAGGFGSVGHRFSAFGRSGHHNLRFSKKEYFSSVSDFMGSVGDSIEPPQALRNSLISAPQAGKQSTPRAICARPRSVKWRT
jgi:hypothetical protein